LPAIPSEIVLAQEPGFGLLCHHRSQLDLMGRKLGLGNDIADPAHNKKTVLDRGIKKVLDMVTIAQIASVAVLDALSGSNVCLVPLSSWRLGHCKFINTGDVPEVVVHTARLGIHKRIPEVVGRGEEHMPLGSAEETLVTREVAGVDLLASDKVEICDGVVDLVGGVGGVHYVYNLIGTFMSTDLIICYFRCRDQMTSATK